MASKDSTCVPVYIVTNQITGSSVEGVFLSFEEAANACRNYFKSKKNHSHDILRLSVYTKTGPAQEVDFWAFDSNYHDFDEKGDCCFAKTSDMGKYMRMRALDPMKSKLCKDMYLVVQKAGNPGGDGPQFEVIKGIYYNKSSALKLSNTFSSSSVYRVKRTGWSKNKHGFLGSEEAAELVE